MNPFECLVNWPLEVKRVIVGSPNRAPFVKRVVALFYDMAENFP